MYELFIQEFITISEAQNFSPEGKVFPLGDHRNDQEEDALFPR
jgi:hypothetical protein